MIRHIVYGNELVLLSGHDAGDVLLQFVAVFRPDKVLPAFDGKHNVDVDLRVGVRHARKMPLLTELGESFWFALVLQRCRAYGAGDVFGFGFGSTRNVAPDGLLISSSILQQNSGIHHLARIVPSCSGATSSTRPNRRSFAPSTR